METRITRDVLDSYVFCKYKSYLKLINQQGIKSDYESLIETIRNEVKLKGIEKIRAQIPENQIVSNIVLTAATLKQGASYILDATIEDNFFIISCDGLKKVPGVSKLGQFLYVPILFYEGGRIHKEQRLLLEMYALFLSRYQEIIPDRGIIWHSREGKTTTVHLNPNPQKAKQILFDLQKLLSAKEPPKLILNDHCHICEFHKRCHEQALEEDNLSLLRGISEKEIKGYSRKGILTVTQLAHTFRPRRKSKQEGKKTNYRYPALQGLAIKDKRIYVLGTPELSQSPVYIYLDVESNPDTGLIYLIGMIVIENGLETRYSFWADNKAQELEIFEQFIYEVTRHQDFIAFCYGAYERIVITQMRKMTKNEALVDRILKNLVNILSFIYAHIYFPTYSNSLKDIGRCVGCSWTELDASGTQSIVWRSNWEIRRDVDWKQKLITYNLEDCIALAKVTEILRLIAAKTHSEEVLATENRTRPPIVLVKDVEKSADYHTWGQVNFVSPDFEFINKCAYFDYQRERVYVRTSKPSKKNTASKPPSPNRKVKASKQLVIIADQCPICGSKDVISGVKKQVRTQEPRVKRAFDIVISSDGARRRVIECRTSVHQCLTCGKEFVPSEHQRLDRHFHGLKSWAMFQHIAYRVNIETLSKMFDEFFGIRVFRQEISMFKSLMSSYYKLTYQKLFEKILSGTLLHVDETQVQLRVGKGYVWVFTNLEEVVYMYRPTREGEFLHELLQKFHGVLVSDFYAAYDGIKCPQQKCIIHLIRDINQELLDNPFDEQLRAITQPFGALLRKIITTVDEYGLKRKYLMEHEPEVKKFFQVLGEQSTSSEPTEALRMRLLKYQDKLFTFIKYDGIPWNNNNAEHAIKQFAYFRETNIIQSMGEPALSDYLVLLSVCQTCQYKDISFLKFLLSREQDMDVFCQKKHQKVQIPSIELYPEGFVPPLMANRRKTKSHQEHNETEISA